jgi:hypothetical protein
LIFSKYNEYYQSALLEYYWGKSFPLKMDSVINSKKYHDLLAIVKGFRNGAVYGCPLLIKVPKFDFHMPW